MRGRPMIGLARVVEQGVTKSASFAYTADSVLKVERDSGQVAYYIDDGLVYTSSVDDSTEPLWLQAALPVAQRLLSDTEPD